MYLKAFLFLFYTVNNNSCFITKYTYIDFSFQLIQLSCGFQDLLLMDVKKVLFYESIHGCFQCFWNTGN